MTRVMIGQRFDIRYRLPRYSRARGTRSGIVSMAEMVSRT